MKPVQGDEEEDPIIFVVGLDEHQFGLTLEQAIVLRDKLDEAITAVQGEQVINNNSEFSITAGYKPEF